MFPSTNIVHHFHPIAWVEQMRLVFGEGGGDCESLIWGNKVSCEFREKVIKIAINLWGEDKKIEMANNLMAVFAWESGGTFKSDAPNMGNSGGTGLIQFMPETAKGLLNKEITIETVKNYWGKGKNLKRVKEFAQMTDIEQLSYVEKYFKRLKGKELKFVDFYLQVLFPASMGKSDDHVVFSKDGSGLSKTDRHYNLRIKAYSQNKGFDTNEKYGNNDGQVTKGEIKKSIQKYLNDGKKYKNNCNDGSCTLGSEKNNNIIENGVILNFIGKSSKESSLSIKTKNILKEVGKISGNENIIITSTARTPYDQARIMYNNCKAGLQEQRNTYKSPGQKVIDVYVEETKNKKTRTEIISAMEKKIKSLGASSVSSHCADQSIINTFDISYANLKDKTKFWNEMKKRVELDKILNENKCYHIQIKQ